jgi:hypothetical protein
MEKGDLILDQRVREGLVGRDILVSSRTSESCGGPGAVRTNQGCQVHGGRMTFVSPEPVREL